MKKTLLYSLICIFTTLYSCSEDTADISFESSVPEFSLIGDAVVLVPQYETYSDAGVAVTELIGEDSNEISDFKTYTTVDETLPGQYKITYSATNSDGVVFYSDFSRTVVVYNDDVTGIYKSKVTRSGDPKYDFDAGITVLIVKVGDDTYSISDWNGGYYDQYAGYGESYAFSGFMGIDSTTGVVSHKTSSDPWGYAGALLEDPAPNWDKATNTIHFVYDWSAGYQFDVTLEKVN